jgi:hypothetical protein
METSGQLHAAAAILSVRQPWYAFCKRLDAVQKRGIFCFCRESNPDFLVVQIIKPTDLSKLKYKCIRICLICHVGMKLLRTLQVQERGALKVVRSALLTGRPEMGTMGDSTLGQ